MVLGTFNARGRNINVVGSYTPEPKDTKDKDGKIIKAKKWNQKNTEEKSKDTNPSFALKISSLDDKFAPVDIANSLGYALRQKEMLVVSPSMSDKLFQTNATFINIKDVSFDKVRKIYDKLFVITIFTR